jgi:hypothetical protein
MKSLSYLQISLIYHAQLLGIILTSTDSLSEDQIAKKRLQFSLQTFCSSQFCGKRDTSINKTCRAAYVYTSVPTPLCASLYVRTYVQLYFVQIANLSSRKENSRVVLTNSKHNLLYNTSTMCHQPSWGKQES